MVARLREMLSRIRGSLMRRWADEDFDSELQIHLEMLAERFERRGMSREDALCAARRQFGGIVQIPRNTS
jgi:hypothetical protein